MKRSAGAAVIAVAVTLLSQAVFNEVRLGDEVVDWTLVLRAGLAGAIAFALRGLSYAVVRSLRRAIMSVSHCSRMSTRWFQVFSAATARRNAGEPTPPCSSA